MKFKTIKSTVDAEQVTEVGAPFKAAADHPGDGLVPVKTAYTALLPAPDATDEQIADIQTKNRELDAAHCYQAAKGTSVDMGDYRVTTDRGVFFVDGPLFEALFTSAE